MTYVRYGAVFRTIRQQKGLSLSYFEKLGFDKSSIARFERGETMIGLERVDVMLQAMNVSLAEYELILNYFVPNFQEEFLFELEQAEQHLDRTKMEQLYEEVKETEYHFLALAAKAKLNGLTASEIQQIMSYLDKVKQWGEFELALTFAVLEYIDTSDLIRLLSIFDLRNRSHYSIPKYQRKIYQIAYRAVFVLGSRGEKDIAYDILRRTQPLSSGLNHDMIDFYLANFRKLVEGFIKYQFNNKEEGQKEIARALELFEELGNKELRNYFEHRLCLFLGKNK